MSWEPCWQESLLVDLVVWQQRQLGGHKPDFLDQRVRRTW